MPSNLPGNTGAALIDQQVQGGQAQSSVPIGVPLTTPESVIYAPIGYVLTTNNGKLWVKTTDESVATGWKQATLT